MSHARAGSAEQISTAVVTEVINDLDKHARAVYETVRVAIATYGYPLSLREIGERVGLTSLSSVKHQLDKLERLGPVRRDPNRPRATEVVCADSAPSGRVATPGSVYITPLDSPSTPGVKDGETVTIPLVGRIATGASILTEQEAVGVMVLPCRLTGEDELFVLEAHGDPMIETAICDGDWAVAYSQPDTAGGEIVAAVIESVDDASAIVEVPS